MSFVQDHFRIRSISVGRIFESHFNVISLSRWKIFMANGSVFHTRATNPVIAKSCSKQTNIAHTQKSSEMGLRPLCIPLSFFLVASNSPRRLFHVFFLFLNRAILSEYAFLPIRIKANKYFGSVFFCLVE